VAPNVIEAGTFTRGSPLGNPRSDQPLDGVARSPRTPKDPEERSTAPQYRVEEPGAQSRAPSYECGRSGNPATTHRMVRLPLHLPPLSRAGHAL
jgi:hypothetical protein